MTQKEYSFDEAVDEIIRQIRKKRGAWVETKQERLLLAFKNAPDNSPSREDVASIFEGSEADAWSLAQKKMSEINTKKLIPRGYRIGDPKTLGVVKINQDENQ